MRYRGPEAQEWRKHTSWAYKSKKIRPVTAEAVEVSANTDGSAQSRPAKRQKMKQKTFSNRRFSKLSGNEMVQRAEGMRTDAGVKEQAARDLLSSNPETAHIQMETAHLQREEAERHLNIAKETIAAETARKAEKLEKKEHRRANKASRKPSWFKFKNSDVASTAIGGSNSVEGGMSHGIGGGTGQGIGLGTIPPSSGTADTPGSGVGQSSASAGAVAAQSASAISTGGGC